MALSTLTIDLTANLARFEADLGKSVRIAEQSAAQMDRAFSALKTTIAGLGIATLVKDQLDGFKAAIDAADHLNDLSKSTGIAVETLGGIGFAAGQAGGSLESVSAAAGKLNKSIAEAAAGNKTAAEAFDVLGVSVRDASGNVKGADAVLIELAGKFASYEDGPNKAALALRLFGKAGADIIPLLDDGAKSLQDNIEYYKQYSGVTQQLAEQSDAFNDTLGKVALVTKSFAVTVASELLPVLQILADQLLTSKENSSLFGTVAAGLRVTLETLAVSAADTSFVLKTLGDTLGAYLATLEKVVTFDIAGARAIGQAYEEQSKTRRQSLDDYVAAVLSAGAKVSKVELEPNGLGQSTELPDAPGLKNRKGRGTAAVDPTVKAYDDIVRAINARVTATSVEIETGQKLTDAQKFALDIELKLTDAKYKFTTAQKQGIGVRLEEQIARENGLKIDEDVLRAQKQSYESTIAEIDGINRVMQARVDSTLQLQFEAQTYGLTSDQVEALTTVRMEELLAFEQRRIAVLESLDLIGEEADALSENAQALRKNIEARKGLATKRGINETSPTVGATKAVEDYLEKIRKAGESTKQVVSTGLSTLESDLTNSLLKGKLDVSSFVDFTISEFLRLGVVQPLIKNLIDSAGGASGIGSIIGKLSGFFAAGDAFGSTGPVPFARGDIFDKPTLFKFANGGSMATGVMGEAGPEAVMPLKRGRDGKLGVAAGGGAAPVVNTTINVGAGVSRGEVVSLLQGYSQTIKGEILGSIRNGGAFAR